MGRPKPKQRLTRTKRQVFLERLRKNVGNVSLTCKQMKLARMSVYQWRDEDADFAAAWDDVLEEATEQAERELYRRAVEGWNKPIYQGGEKVGIERQFSDTCLIFMLKARKPEKYCQVQKIAPTTPDGQNPYVGASTEDLRDLAARIAGATVVAQEGPQT